MHKEVIKFCENVKQQYTGFFVWTNVLDVGSLDINGNNRYLLGERCRYFGIDLIQGKNVDIVCPVKDFNIEMLKPLLKDGVKINNFDLIICTEMLEHDKDYDLSLKKMWSLLRTGGMLLITCAAPGRPEHGTFICRPEDSPATHEWYLPINYEMFNNAIPVDKHFLVYDFEIDNIHHDFRFWGIK